MRITEVYSLLLTGIECGFLRAYASPIEIANLSINTQGDADRFNASYIAIGCRSGNASIHTTYIASEDKLNIVIDKSSYINGEKYSNQIERGFNSLTTLTNQEVYSLIDELFK